MKISCYVLCVPSAFLWTGLVLSLLFAIAFLSLLVAPLAPCQKMLYPSFCARSFLRPGHLDLRWVPFEPMKFAVSPPLSPSTGTGQSPRSWSPPLGAQVRCFPHFTCATFSMNTMAFAHWVRSWLRVRGSSSPHLFLTCSGGRGVLRRPCLRFCMAPAPASVTGCGACPSSFCAGSGVPSFVFLFVLPLVLFFIIFCFLCLFVLCVSQPKMSRGVVLFGHMT